MRTRIITDRSTMESIIAQCDICFVGVTELDGSPYVIPMNFGYKDGILILHSATEGKHIRLLANDNRVCITFCTEGKLLYQHPDVACSYSMQSSSVICKGYVNFIENHEAKEEALRLFMTNYSDREFKFSVPAVKHVALWQIQIEEMTAKSFGNNFKQK
jgi:nitroimidazol reductase NimA-like FMN-containing flavoprotein (pyridoxamine 5'-phosphate oxidase superfamily)